MCACTKHGATYIGSNFQKQFCNSKCSVFKKMLTWYSQTWCYTQWQWLSKTIMHLDSFALVYCSLHHPNPYILRLKSAYTDLQMKRVSGLQLSITSIHFQYCHCIWMQILPHAIYFDAGPPPATEYRWQTWWVVGLKESDFVLDSLAFDMNAGSKWVKSNSTCAWLWHQLQYFRIMCTSDKWLYQYLHPQAGVPPLRP